MKLLMKRQIVSFLNTAVCFLPWQFSIFSTKHRHSLCLHHLHEMWQLFVGVRNCFLSIGMKHQADEAPSWLTFVIKISSSPVDGLQSSIFIKFKASQTHVGGPVQPFSSIKITTTTNQVHKSQQQALPHQIASSAASIML